MNTAFGGIAATLMLLFAARLISGASRPARHPDTTGGASAEGVGSSVAAQRHGPLTSARRLVNAALQRLRLQRRAVRLGRGACADSVAAWADALARRLRSGDTLREAVQHEIPADDVLAALTNDLRHRIARGQPLPTATQSVQQQPGRTPGAAARQDGRQDGRQGGWKGGQHLALICSVIGAAADFGGSAAAPLDRASTALRLRAADGQERSAQSAQARLSAHVLTVVPVGILILLASTDPDVRVVLSSPVGLSVVSLGLLLNGAGWMWMRHIVGGAQ